MIGSMTMENIDDAGRTFQAAVILLIAFTAQRGLFEEVLNDKIKKIILTACSFLDS